VQRLYTDKLFSKWPVMLVFLLLCVPALAQKRKVKQERITLKNVPGETKQDRKIITPRRRKQLQSQDFINRRKTYRDKLTKREKRQIDKVSGVDRKAERKKQRKEIKEKKQIARAEKKLRKKHLAIHTPDVRKQMKNNYKKTIKELHQKKRNNRYSQKPKKRKQNR